MRLVALSIGDTDIGSDTNRIEVYLEIVPQMFCNFSFNNISWFRYVYYRKVIPLSYNTVEVKVVMSRGYYSRMT